VPGVSRRSIPMSAVVEDTAAFQVRSTPDAPARATLVAAAARPAPAALRPISDDGGVEPTLPRRPPVRPPVGPGGRPAPRPPVVRPGRFPYPGTVLLRGQPRRNMQVPITPTLAFDAATVFEAPDAPATRFYVPLYDLAEEVVDGQRRFRLAMRQAGDAWRVTLFLTPGPRVPGAQPIGHDLAGILRFTPPTSAVSKELAFVLEKESDTAWKATLTVATLNERDQLFFALTRPEYRAQFVVRCTVRAAVPVAQDATTGEPLYRPSVRVIDVFVSRDPFVFDTRQHPDIFREVTNPSDQRFGVTLRQVEHRGRTHHYYQDQASPCLFYFLPDHIKVTRRPTAPFTPNMLVKFSSPDGSLENMRATVEYSAAPVIDPERLDAARLALRAHLPSPMPAGITEAVFQPLVVTSRDQLELRVAIPRADAGGAPLTARPGVVTNLTDSFDEQIAGLTLPAFQELFDALFGKSAVIFLGEVFVAGGGQRPDGSVPFVARLDDLHGAVFEETEVPGPDGIRVSLRNGIESPVVVRGLPVEVLAGGETVPARLEQPTLGGAAASFPVSLPAGGELSFRVVPSQPLAAGVTPEALVELDDVKVEPDATAVWNAILDASLPAEYVRTIRVVGLAEMFAPTTDVLAIAVDFDGGDGVILKRDALEAQAKVRMPVADVVLRKVQEAEYGYTLVVMRQSGQTRLRKRDSLDILVPDTSA
jgi:hypothetical protein